MNSKSDTVEVRLPADIAGRVGKIASDLGVDPAEVVRSAILNGLSRLGDGNQRSGLGPRPEYATRFPATRSRS